MRDTRHQPAEPTVKLPHPHPTKLTARATKWAATGKGQQQEVCTPSPALRHSDTTMAEPTAPRKTRPRSPTQDAAHEVIRALGLRGGDAPPPPPEVEDVDTDLEKIPGAPAGSAPAGPAPPAGSVPALCPAWKQGHCTGEGWCPRQQP